VQERSATVWFASSRAIREEIVRAVPLCAGIERLNEQGDEHQGGGRQTVHWPEANALPSREEGDALRHEPATTHS